MSTAKLQIATGNHAKDELASILSDYTSIPLVHKKQLFGGYSGSSYLAELHDGSRYVIKISNGYTTDHAEFMCRTAYHLGRVGYKDCCLPIPKTTTTLDDTHDDELEFVSSREKNGEPAFLLTYVDGQQADAVMREKPRLASTVMCGIGGGLGRMHAASTGIGKAEARNLRLRWYESDGGCCDVQDQTDGKVMGKIMGCKKVRDHEFIPFYASELVALKSEMRLVEDGLFAFGITHGDPFADNVLVNSESGELSAFIDIEDVCVGPLIFDLACCAIGCCFKASPDVDGKYPQVLDMSLLSSLFDGYCSDRTLPGVEKQHFVRFMRLTLLCNCCWRFVKFNVGAEEDVPEEAKNSYIELRQRIEYLHDYSVVQEIQRLLDGQQ